MSQNKPFLMKGKSELSQNVSGGVKCFSFTLRDKSQLTSELLSESRLPLKVFHSFRRRGCLKRLSWDNPRADFNHILLAPHFLIKDTFHSVSLCIFIKAAGCLCCRIHGGGTVFPSELERHHRMEKPVKIASVEGADHKTAISFMTVLTSTWPYLSN